MTDNMDLKTFISTTLVQIIEGVSDAITKIEKNTHSIEENLHLISAKINPINPSMYHCDPKDVEFDVAVMVTDASSKEGGAGIKVAAIQLSGKGELKTESSAVSRIKFSIPVSVPSMPVDEYAKLHYEMENRKKHL